MQKCANGKSTTKTVNRSRTKKGKKQIPLLKLILRCMNSIKVIVHLSSKILKQNSKYYTKNLMKTNSECKPCRSYATLEHIQIIKYKTHPTQQIVNTKAYT